MPEITQVADARPGRILVGVRKRAFHLDHLERKAGGRGDRVGENARGAGAAHLQGLLFEFGAQAGFIAERKRRSHLDTGGAEAQGIGQPARPPIRTGQPERQTERADFFEVNHIALAVHRFADGIELQRAARRGVVAAGGVALDHEAVHASVGFFGQRHGERGRSDDAEELRTFGNRQLAVAESARVELWKGTPRRAARR